MVTKISKGGQISIPAAVRKRWKTEKLVIEDQGSRLVVRPLPKDPIAATYGVFKHLRGPDLEEVKEQLRREEREAEERKFGYLRKRKGKKPLRPQKPKR